MLAFTFAIALYSSPYAPCDVTEMLAYVAAGSDGLTCDSDKAAQLAEDLEGDACAETDEGCVSDR